MKYSLAFFAPEVRTGILNWPPSIRAAFFRIAERMEAHGPNLGMPYTRALGNGLFEIRAKGTEGIGRAFFCTLEGQRIVILHEFIKKTESIPQRELAIAIQRKNTVKSHG